MLVYGDHRRLECPGDAVERLDRGWRTCRGLAGPQRHVRLVELLIEAGELAQGLLDHAFAEAGRDRDGGPPAPPLKLTLALARALGRTLRGEATPPVLPGLEGCRRTALPREVLVHEPEGYAFYALYPETYYRAALSPSLGPATLVIGLRSIGTSLACMVAAAIGTEDVLTLRPIGPPLDRRLSLAPDLALRLASASAPIAIVDEGPGYSGSSLGAVADFLEDSGVPRPLLHFFPAHSGPLGPAAKGRHRRRWGQVPKHVVSFEEVFLDSASPGPRLTELVEDLTGPPLGPLLDLGAGAWRELLFPRPGEWPPAHLQQERRKFLLRTRRGDWLLKFAGLGRYGRARLSRARVLQRAGFIPEVAGLRHGFLIQRWQPARPLPLVAELDRGRLVGFVADYLTLLARELPARHAAGASPAALLEMARINAAEALGHEVAARLERWATRLGELARDERRVATDNRMHAWEWLVLESGQLLKADALDHHAAHDLVGCQDLGWDLAGAAVELALTRREEHELLQRLEHRGAWGQRARLPFYRCCYLAFQLGHATLGASTLSASYPEESQRLARSAERYAELLERELLRDERS